MHPRQHALHRAGARDCESVRGSVYREEELDDEGGRAVWRWDQYYALIGEDETMSTDENGGHLVMTVDADFPADGARLAGWHTEGEGQSLDWSAKCASLAAAGARPKPGLRSQVATVSRRMCDTI